MNLAQIIGIPFRLVFLLVGYLLMFIVCFAELVCTGRWTFKPNWSKIRRAALRGFDKNDLYDSR